MIESTQAHIEQTVKLYANLLDVQGEVTIPLVGNCMWPTARNGDQLTLRQAPYEELRFGDLAVFKISPDTLHANLIFFPKKLKPHSKQMQNRYFGKVCRITRGNAVVRLDQRSGIKRFGEMLCCLSNPWFWNAPRILLRKTVSG